MCCTLFSQNEEAWAVRLYFLRLRKSMFSRHPASEQTATTQQESPCLKVWNFDCLQISFLGMHFFCWATSMIFSLQCIPWHLLRVFSCPSVFGSSIYSFHSGTVFEMRQLMGLISILHIIICNNVDTDFPVSKLSSPK